MSQRTTTGLRKSVAAIGAASLVAAALAACSPDSVPGEQERVTITLAGPNQWNTESSTFGTAWEELIERFEAEETGIEVETVVLPLSNFRDTLSTQLSAGTAPELVFRAVPHTPDQVHALDEYLAQPNPYVEGNEKWLDIFDSRFYGDAQRNVNGDLEFIPFNLVIAGLFYNEDVFEQAGIEGPIDTYSQLIEACDALSAEGYVPLAMDSGTLGTGWLVETFYDMMLDKYADEWNVYLADGTEGKAESTLSAKSMAHAILTGSLDATSTPEIRETVELLGEVFDRCATPNWSGIPSSATFVGGDEFIAGDAAMALGTNFAVGALDDVDWSWQGMPIPTIDAQASSLSNGTTARFGASVGGTSYMIPATTEGAELEAAVKFLQYISSTEGGEQWLQESGGIPATLDAEASPGLESLMEGSWAEPKRIDMYRRAAATSGQNLYEGYLLGSRSIDEQLDTLQQDLTTWANEAVSDAGWTEDWATQ